MDKIPEGSETQQQDSYINTFDLYSCVAGLNIESVNSVNVELATLAFRVQR